jgi:hypothetical protein
LTQSITGAKPNPSVPGNPSKFQGFSTPKLDTFLQTATFQGCTTPLCETLLPSWVVRNIPPLSKLIGLLFIVSREWETDALAALSIP